jgi:hypothetical protein
MASVACAEHREEVSAGAQPIGRVEATRGSQPVPPARIGRYRLVSRIGAGGMGTVFLAHDRRGRPVALKLLHPHLRDDPRFRHRFTQEVEAASRVASFCTARVLHADPQAHTPYLVTEYVPGLSLREWVRRHGPLSERDTVALAAGVAEALSAIHAVSVVHRDLTPGNVLLSPTGPKVIDFGIASARGRRADAAAPSVPFGTPGWLAPEQVAGRPVAAPADVFAWGLLVSWAATGRHPFGAAGVASGLPDLGGVPARLAPLVRGALAADPLARPSARDLVLALCGSAGSAAVQTVTAPLARPVPVPVRAPRAEAPRAKAPRTLPLPPVQPADGANSRPAAVRRRSAAAPRPAARRRRPRARVLVLLLGILLVGAWLARGEQTGGAGPAGADPPRPAPSKASPALPGTARDGSLRFTLAGLRCGDTDLGQWPTHKHTEGTFCLVRLDVTNLGTHRSWVFQSSQRLIDASGREYPADDWSWVYYPDSRPFTSVIGPGATVTGTLVFDVPRDRRFTHLVVHDTPVSRGSPLGLG